MWKGVFDTSTSVTLGPLATSTTTTVLGPVTGGSQRSGCPGAGTCPRFSPGTALPVVDGRIEIAYHINPSGATTANLSPGRLVGAINAATRAWHAVDPRLNFRYLGRTTRPAGEPGVVAFGTPCRHGSHPACGGIIDGKPTVTFSDRAPWSWQLCGVAGDGEPCTPYEQPCRPLEGNLRCEGIDLQAIATHEWGHVLGLEDLFGAEAEGLTMYARAQITDPNEDMARRDLSTLGWGDILGLRALYRTTHPLPPVVVP